MQNKDKQFLKKLLTLFEEFEAEISFKELNEYTQEYIQGKMIIRNKNWEVLLETDEENNEWYINTQILKKYLTDEK